MTRPSIARQARAQRSFFLYLKGMAMGAADVVPGVSGGTIALITGIYQELLESISRIGAGALKVLKDDGFVAAWNYINGGFLLILVSGILTSAALFSHLILFALSNYPIPVWSFFFGLIAASAIHIGGTITHWKSVLTYLFAGVFVGYLVTDLAPINVEFSYLYLFVSGAIAICAMILPGISGSFILLVLGMYTHVLMAIKGFDLPVLLVFGAGCVIGLLAFSKLLSWLLRHAHNVTMAVLLGIMIGSLNRIWPWKQVLAYQINANGDQVAIAHRNVLPAAFGEITGDEPQLLLAVAMMIAGLVVVFLPGLVIKCGRNG